MARLFYERIPTIENHDPLVDLDDYPFICEPAYFQQGLADSPKLYTRKAIAEKMLALQSGAFAGYKFKIWDPWRSRGTQARIFHKFRDELQARHPDWDDEKLYRELTRYVADPDRADRIPFHSSGGSIDLTLVDAATGIELDMGTGFDHFGIEARPDYFEQSGGNIAVRDNRRLFQAGMLSAGFTQDPDEWWHFDYGNPKWAEAAGKTYAFYGEAAMDPAPVNHKSLFIFPALHAK